MKYTCTICYRYATRTLKSVLRHIGAVHSFEPGFSITCGVRGCARTYKNFRSFRKHLLRQHEADMERTSNTSSAPGGNESSTENDDTANEDLGDDEPADCDTLTDKKRSAALFLLKTKEICRVTQSALNHIVEGMTELFQVHTDDSTARPFKGLETAHLQEKYYREELNLLDPVEKRLGQSLRRKKVKGRTRLKLCWDCAYYIPLLDSLQRLLSIDWILEEIQRGHKRSDSLLGDYCDGDACSSHPLFSKDPEALQILLFYDDLEVANPLGSYTKKHKIAVFYYTLANVSPQYRSSLDMIQLICTVKTVDVNTYGVDKVLEPFLEDIEKLEADEGVDFNIKGRTYNFNGSLALIPADNLASQSIGGYKALNSALRKCRHCMAVSEDMRTKFLATDFRPRTRATHKAHCDLLQIECPDHVATTYGLTRDSALNTLKYFHVTEGLPPDCMHDMLEGTLQYEIKELLKSLIAQGFLSLETLSSRIQLFPYCASDATNRPSTLTSLSSTDHSLKQSASQMWCLARLLPLIIGDLIPEDDDHWLNFLRLLKITGYVFSPLSSRSIAAYLTSLIEDYLCTFTELYSHCQIIPKQHYMVHIPKWIVRCGPMTRYWCMRFEAKNSHFKDIIQRIRNFKNVPKSLALRHQGWSCYNNASFGTSSQKELTTGPVRPAELNQLPYARQLCAAVPTITEETNIQMSSWVQINGTKYKPRDIVVLSTSSSLPIFGVILSLLITEVTKCHFVCEVLLTHSFNSHYHAYQVGRQAERPTPIVICGQKDFLDHHILALYHVSDFDLIPLKYHLPEC